VIGLALFLAKSLGIKEEEKKRGEVRIFFFAINLEKEEGRRLSSSVDLFPPKKRKGGEEGEIE